MRSLGGDPGWRQRVLAERGDPTEHFPYAFASGDEAFPRIAGGVLWLVTSPHFGAYAIPPSLVARLEVIDVVPCNSAQAQDLDIEVLRSGGWVALAARRRGAYLPVNNALHTLQQLRFRGVVDRLPDLGMEVAARDHEDHEDQEEREEREDGDSLRLYSGYSRAVPAAPRRSRGVRTRAGGLCRGGAQRPTGLPELSMEGLRSGPGLGAAGCQCSEQPAGVLLVGPLGRPAGPTAASYRADPHRDPR